MSIFSRLRGSHTMTPQQLEQFLRSFNIERGNALADPEAHGQLHLVPLKGGVYVSSDSSASGITTRRFHKACNRLTACLNKHRDRLERQGLNVDAALLGVRQLKHNTGKRFGENDLAAFKGWRNEDANKAMSADVLDIRTVAALWKGWRADIRKTVSTGEWPTAIDDVSSQAAMQAKDKAFVDARDQGRLFAAQCLPDESRSAADDDDRTNLVNWLNAALQLHGPLTRYRAHTLHQALLCDQVKYLADQQVKLSKLLAEEDSHPDDPAYAAELRLRATLLTTGIEDYLDGLIQAATILSGQFRVNELPKDFHFILVSNGKALTDLFMANLNPSGTMMQGYRQAHEVLSAIKSPLGRSRGLAASEQAQSIPEDGAASAQRMSSSVEDGGDDAGEDSGEGALRPAHSFALGQHRDAARSSANTLSAEQAAIAACEEFFEHGGEAPSAAKHRLMDRLQKKVHGHPETEHLDLGSLQLRLQNMPQFFGSKYRQLEELVRQRRQERVDPALDEKIQGLSRRWQQGVLDHIRQIEIVGECLRDLAEEDGVATEFKGAMADTARKLLQAVSRYREPTGPMMVLWQTVQAFQVPAQDPIGQVSAEIDDFVNMLEKPANQEPVTRQKDAASVPDIFRQGLPTPALRPPRVSRTHPAVGPSLYVPDSAEFDRELRDIASLAGSVRELMQQDQLEERVQQVEREDPQNQQASGPDVPKGMAGRATPAEVEVEPLPLQFERLERSILDKQGQLNGLFEQFDGFSGASGSRQRDLWTQLETQLGQLGIDIDFMDLALARLPAAIEQGSLALKQAAQNQEHDKKIVELSQESVARIQSHLTKLHDAAQRMQAFADRLPGNGGAEDFKALLGNTANALLELEALHRHPFSPLMRTQQRDEGLGQEAQQRLDNNQRTGEAAKEVDLELDEQAIREALKARDAAAQGVGGKIIGKVKNIFRIGGHADGSTQSAPALPQPSDSRSMVPLAPQGQSVVARAQSGGNRGLEVDGATALNVVNAVQAPKLSVFSAAKLLFQGKKGREALIPTIRPPVPGAEAVRLSALPSPIDASSPD